MSVNKKNISILIFTILFGLLIVLLLQNNKYKHSVLPAPIKEDLQQAQNSPQQETEPKSVDIAPEQVFSIAVDTDGTNIENKQVSGNVLILEAVGNGTVTLNNLLINGDLIIKGGGPNSVHLINCVIEGKTQIEKENVRLVLQNNTQIATLEIYDSTKITNTDFIGKVDRVIIKPSFRGNSITIDVPISTIEVFHKVNLSLTQNIQSIVVDKLAEGTSIDVAPKSSVNRLLMGGKTVITGSGHIETIVTADNSSKTEPNQPKIKGDTTTKSVPNSSSQTTEKSTFTTTSKLSETPVEKPTAPSTVPSTEPVEKPTAPSTVPSTEPVEKPTVPPTVPSTEPVEKPTVPPTVPSTEPVEKPTVPPTAPSTEPVEKPIIPPTVPSTEPVEKPTVPPTAPSTEPVEDPVDAIEVKPTPTIPSTDISGSSHSTSAEQMIDYLSTEKNDNITQYEKDGKTITTLWVKGITPPTMGGDDDFKKIDSDDREYYVTAYLPNKGWYDTNKSRSDKAPDDMLCSGAVAANMLHWWLEQNAHFVENYVSQDGNGIVTSTKYGTRDIRDYIDSFGGQEESQIFDLCKKDFGALKTGIWADTTVDLFINGYQPRDGWSNNAEFYTKDDRGGFFFPVFDKHILTDRTSVRKYKVLEMRVKDWLQDGRVIGISHTTHTTINHIITVWGADFDEKKHLVGLYITDSDDKDTTPSVLGGETVGMKRLNVYNYDGLSKLSIHKTDPRQGARAIELFSLSLGENIWADYFKTE